MRLSIVIATCLLIPITGTGHAQDSAGSGTVTVYRCTDASGKQSLRDTPCPKGQKQQTREMLRPRDAPTAPALAPTVVSPPPQQATHTRPVYITPPQPMYECVTPDGERYTSETADGNPRWVPFWTQGYRWYGDHGTINASRGAFRPAPPLSAGISTAPPRPPGTSPAPRPQHPVPWTAASGGGQWIRDTCTALPPGEVCSILRDRRDAIRTRFFNAQEKERDSLRVEQRRIDARLANDCGRR